MMHIGRYAIGWYRPGRWEWRWRQREYWHRRILGPIYILRGRRDADST